MSLPELVVRITESLQASAALLQQLGTGLRQHRTAWISARPGTLSAPVQALDPIARDLQAEDSRRSELLERARGLLPTPPGAAGRRHVDAQALLPFAAPAAAARLQQAATQAATAAAAVRRELALGQRLLQFTRNAHDQLLASVGSALTTAADVGGYDQTARRVQRALPTAGATPGSLIDGRI